MTDVTIQSNKTVLSEVKDNQELLEPPYRKKQTALAGVAQWIEHRSANQWVTGSIPSQDTCLGCGPVP